jgi:hypothetical protein
MDGKRKNRPAGTGRLTTTTTTLLRVTDDAEVVRLQAAVDCPLARAAFRSRDAAVIAAVARHHPPSRCPAIRRERAR